MGVSKNKGTPQWIVKIMETPIKIHDLGGFPPILETPFWCVSSSIDRWLNLVVSYKDLDISLQFGCNFSMGEGQNTSVHKFLPICVSLNIEHI